MSVDVQHPGQHPGLFRFSCIAAALAVATIPASSFAASLQSGDSHQLHDTYYVVADADRLATMAAFAICHLIAAAGCSMLAGVRVGGWVLAASATVFVLAQSVPGIVLSLMPMPQRYADYIENSPMTSLAWLFEAAQYASYITLVGMIAGWVMLALSVRRRPAS